MSTQLGIWDTHKGIYSCCIVIDTQLGIWDTHEGIYSMMVGTQLGIWDTHIGIYSCCRLTGSMLEYMVKFHPHHPPDLILPLFFIGSLTSAWSWWSPAV